MHSARIYQLQTGFGLLDETPERWTKFKEAVASMLQRIFLKAQTLT